MQHAGQIPRRHYLARIFHQVATAAIQMRGTAQWNGLGFLVAVLTAAPLCACSAAANRSAAEWPALPAAAFAVAPPQAVPNFSPPISFRAGVAWLEDRSSDPALYAEASEDLHQEQIRLLEGFSKALVGAPIHELLLMRPTRRSRGEDGPLAEIRALSEKAELFLVVLLRTATRETRTANWLSPLYLLIPLTPLIPGDHLEVLATAEACAFLPPRLLSLGCTTRHAQQRERYVTPLAAPRHQRAARKRALESALGELARALREAQLAPFRDSVRPQEQQPYPSIMDEK